MNEDLSSTIVLTQSAHQIAKNFYRHHKPKQYPKKAKQVYLNTLAVYAVDYYLRHKGFETDWEASYSWNPVMQIFADIGDLLVKNLGKLECRPVLPNKETCYVPPEVWEDRIGYVAVHFNQFLTEAKLLGFLPSVVEEECHLSYFYSPENLLEYLRRISSPYVPSSVNRSVVHLTEWLSGSFFSDWQNIDTFFPQLNLKPVISFRNALTENLSVKRGKLMSFEKEGEKLALLVGLKPGEGSEIDISIEVCSMYPSNYLSPDLQLMVLDAVGTVLAQAQARSNNKSIEFQFSGEQGESFSIKIALGDVIFTEDFLI